MSIFYCKISENLTAFDYCRRIPKIDSQQTSRLDTDDEGDDDGKRGRSPSTTSRSNDHKNSGTFSGTPQPRKLVFPSLIPRIKDHPYNNYVYQATYRYVVETYTSGGVRTKRRRCVKVFTRDGTRRHFRCERDARRGFPHYLACGW